MRTGTLWAIAFAHLLAACVAASGGVDPLDAPWTHDRSVLVIDAYQGNPIDWDALAGDRKVVGVIHRATIGMRVDTAYAKRAKAARSGGYLWGAYHLGRAGAPIEQAELFLATVGSTQNVLLSLDLESFSGPNDMSIEEAIVFIEHVRERTGRTPAIYANHVVAEQLSRHRAFRRAARNAPLWYARFRPDIPRLPQGLWRAYLLWQFSSEINCSAAGACLYNPPGVAYDMDVNVFVGDREELKAAWAP